MPTAQSAIANERQLVRAYATTEDILGVFKVPTFRLYGDLRLNRTAALADRNEYAGTVFKDYTAVRGAVAIDGTYAQGLTYEDFAILPRYAIVGGGTGVTDGETTPAYTYERVPSPTRYDIDFMSGEYGFPGMPFTFTGLHFSEFTVSGDIDAAEAQWMWNANVMALSKDLKDSAVAATTATGGSTTTIVKTGAAWVVNAFAGAFAELISGTAGNIGQKREVLSNTADTLTLGGVLPAAVASGDGFAVSGTFTAGVPDRERETIETPGTIVYIDPAGNLGTTEQTGLISFSVTFTRNSFGKRFMEDTEGYSRYGFGAFVVTGQIRREFDSRDDYDRWTESEQVDIRIVQTGETIDAGAPSTSVAQIDCLNCAYDAITEDDRESNVTQTITFRTYVDPVEGWNGGVTAVIDDATLP